MESITGLMDFRWKQKGQHPIQLTVYDRMITPAWHDLIQEAIEQWNRALPFNLDYCLVTPEIEAERWYNRLEDIAVEETLHSGNHGAIPVPGKNGIISWAWAIIYDGGSYDTFYSSPEETLWHRRHTIRHELGHCLGMADYHNHNCCMTNSNEITQYDLDLLCKRYRC